MSLNQLLSPNPKAWEDINVNGVQAYNLQLLQPTGIGYIPISDALGNLTLTAPGGGHFVESVTAGDASILIGGTAANPTVAATGNFLAKAITTSNNITTTAAGTISTVNGNISSTAGNITTGGNITTSGTGDMTCAHILSSPFEISGTGQNFFTGTIFQLNQQASAVAWTGPTTAITINGATGSPSGTMSFSSFAINAAATQTVNVTNAIVTASSTIILGPAGNLTTMDAGTNSLDINLFSKGAGVFSFIISNNGGISVTGGTLQVGYIIC